MKVKSPIAIMYGQGAQYLAVNIPNFCAWPEIISVDKEKNIFILKDPRKEVYREFDANTYMVKEYFPFE